MERHTETRSGLAFAQLPVEQRDELTTIFGQSTAEALSIAATEKLSLWTDDLCVAGLALAEFGVVRTWTQLISERFLDAGLLAAPALTNLMIRLVSAGYELTQCTPSMVLAAARDADWNANRSPFREVIDWLADPRLNGEAVLAISVNAIREIWHECVWVSHRENATNAIADAVLRRPSGRQSLLWIISNIGTIFRVEPLAADEAARILSAALRRYLRPF